MTTIASRNIEILGTSLKGITDIDEALKIAHLDWNVNLVPANALTVLTEDGVIDTKIPGANLVMRDDTHLTLGVVKGRYRAVSNRDVFSMGTEIMRLGGQAELGGELDYGRRAFMRFALPEAEVAVGGHDLVRFGFDITTAHDGSGHVAARLWALRQICTNGMTAYIPHTNYTVAIRHTGDAIHRIATAGQIIREASAYAKSFAAVAEELISTKFTRSEFIAYIDALYPMPTEDGRGLSIWQNRREDLIGLFEKAPTNEEGRGTAWAAYNAVTEYLDWAAPIRNHGNESADFVRALRQFDGSSQDVKDRAFAALISA